MKFHTVQKKGEELSSQQYVKDRTVQYKKKKSSLPKITPPAVMAKCEVRYVYTDDSSLVVMEGFVNKKLNETHIDISKHDIEINLNDTKMVIEKYTDGHDDDKKKEEGKKVRYIELYLKR